MADDQVKYSDLFESGIDAQVKALTEEIKALRDAISAAKDEAQGMKKELSSMGTATREQQQAVGAQAAAIEKLQKQTSDLTGKEAALIAKLEQLREAQNKNLAGWSLLVRSIDGTNMSYNQMKTTADVLEKQLRSLTTEEEKNSMGAQSVRDAISRLRDAMKSFNNTAADAVKSNKAYKKLTDDEIKSLEKLKVALQGTKMQQMEAVQAIDIQSKSYNELYQTYNALKDVINGMTVAERESTEVGQLMVNRAKEIRDTLNNLQQQTGNYTLNVGNYMSAMNGLQMQTQQILREIPSAQNLSQFFLAISNNIPMFTDALARYNKGLPEIKAKLAAVTAEITRQEAALAGMNVQSTEYAAKQAQINELRRQEQQLQGASVSGWRAILKSVGSWQTLLIAGLLLLRKIPDIVKWIGRQFESTAAKVARLKNEIDSTSASTSAMAAAIQKTADETTALDLIVDSLKNITRGTDEWRDAIETVNDITKSNLDYTKATLDDVYKVTAAYRDQAYQLALNNELMSKIANSQSDKLLTLEVLKADKFETVASLMGINIGTDEYEKMYKKWWDARRDQNFKRFGSSMLSLSPETVDFWYEDYLKQMDKFGRDALDFLTDVRKKYNRVLSSDATADLKDMYRATPGIRTPKVPKEPKTPKEKEPSEQSTTDRYWEAEKALLEAQYEGYQLEQKLAQLNRDKARDEQINWYVDQRLALEENLKNGFITEEKYDQDLTELDRQNKALRESIDEKYWDDLRKLRSKNMKERSEEWEKNAKDNAKRVLKAMADGWQKQRSKLVEQGASRRELIEAEVKAEIARLQTMIDLNRTVNGEIMSNEEKRKVEEWKKLLKKLQEAGNFNGIKSGQIFNHGGANINNGNAHTWTNVIDLLTVDDRGNNRGWTDSLFGDMDTDEINRWKSGVVAAFDQAKAALQTWMNLRKAAADQAKAEADDAVSSAENALNREMDLKAQGYANDVALREKELADAKAAQDKAAAQQKKMALEQQKIDAALQTSSMLVATANLIKSMSLMGPLGIAASVSALGVMWSAFLWSQAQAFKYAKNGTMQFREGGVMLLEGGSHESGHDVNLGIGPDGSNLRAEGGEYFAVINKRSSRKYGSQIPAVVNALNSGMFEDRYIKTSDAVGMMMAGGRTEIGSTVDLGSLESGVSELVKQGESRWSTEGEYRVMRYKNLTRRVRIS